MNLNTVNKNFDDPDKFKEMIEKIKPLNELKAIDIIGFIIAKHEEKYADYIQIVFDNIEDDETRNIVIDAVRKLDDKSPVVKSAVGTSDQIINLITGDDDDEEEEIVVSSSDEEEEEEDWSSSDDEFNYKIS